LKIFTPGLVLQKVEFAEPHRSLRADGKSSQLPSIGA